MSKSREALEMARECLRWWEREHQCCGGASEEAFAKIDAALRELDEVKPVGHVADHDGRVLWHYPPGPAIGTRLYAVPPAPLTPKETLAERVRRKGPAGTGVEEYSRAILPGDIPPTPNAEREALGKWLQDACQMGDVVFSDLGWERLRRIDPILRGDRDE